LEFVNNAIKNGFDCSRPPDKAPAFSVGDRVVIAADSPTGHTRRARYIRGKTGIVTATHGTWVYPDSSGSGGGDAPEHLYTVKFTGAELWGEQTGDPNEVVHIDVFEPYLALAPATAPQGA
jgi:nitrile hydratase subunit beta